MDLERLKQRLRAMTVAQLRGRWKRIEDRLNDSIRPIGESCHKDLREAFLALPTLPEDLSRYLKLESPVAESDDAEWREWYEARHNAALALLIDEAEQEDLRAILETSELDLEKPREFVIQRALVWAELDGRGERPPGYEEEPDSEPENNSAPSSNSENAASSNEDAPQAAEANPNDDAEAPRTRSSRRNRMRNQPSPHPKDKAGDLMERVGKNIKEKVAETTKNAAGSAAKASGKAFWKMATSAFKVGGSSPKKAETPSSPSRRRRRRRRGGGDSESEETLELIEKLHELKERGILSHEEFEEKKSDLLGRL
ncbi:MAG: SHOCT domain-containing protein [Planctomycetota bacterium]|nr:SHOCT domain-containing protein [Planctomycetota bacterium]